MSFELNTVGNLSVLQFQPWVKRGIRHGFIGVHSSVSELPIPQMSQILSKELQVSDLRFLEQVHGNELATSEDSGIPKADGWIIPRSTLPRGYGIVTADCVPVLVYSQTKIALIHAGWRGLTKGILEKALLHFKDQECEVVIGPCAGSSKYEVGKEVIEALGPEAVFTTVTQKIYLSLEQTALKKMTNIARPLVNIASICTIQDQSFHSYRREGKGCGRNVSYMILDV